MRGLLRQFGIKLPSRAGGKKFDEAAYLATRNAPILHAAIRALLESLASIEGQAYMAAIENVERFRGTRDIGPYLALTERRYELAETDVGMGISKQGDAMARHYLY